MVDTDLLGGAFGDNRPSECLLHAALGPESGRYSATTVHIVYMMAAERPKSLITITVQ